MKKLLFKIYSIILGIATIAGWILAIIQSLGIAKAIIVVIVIFIVVSVLCTIGIFVVGKKWNAYRDQKKVGRFQGLWADDGLIEELKRDFKNASNINIKVTRGTELFDVTKKGQIVTHLRELIDRASSENEIRCNFLLIAPCYKLKHVRERHDNHKDQYEKAEDFLKTWYDTLNELKDIGQGKSNVYFHKEVRFYSGRHSKWRFYIFESNGDKKTVLFSDYDAERSKHGSALPMYKILKNDQNIGGFMERYFNEIWDTALTKEELKKLIESGKCVRRFCEVCDTTSGGCESSNCPKVSDFCEYKEKCRAYVKDMNCQGG